MTRVTVGRRSGKMIVDMTAYACRLNMSPRQWKVCFGMVERRRCPCRSRMTSCTIVVEATAHMIWICSIVEVSLVAAIAIAAQSFELTVLVAEETICRQVGSRQRKCCVRVIKRRRFPHVYRMTRYTVV